MVDDNTLSHQYLTILSSLGEIRASIHRLEHSMSDLEGAQAAEAQAITDLSARIDAITAPLVAAVAEAQAAAQAALAQDATDAAAAQAAQARIDTAFANVNAQVDQLNALAQPPAAG